MSNTAATTKEEAKRERTPAQRLLLLIGSFGPLGHAPASGTVTVAVLGIPLWWLLATYTNTLTYTLVTLAFIGVSMAVHHAGDRILGENDSRKIVWDEIAGYFVAMFLVPFSWKAAVAGAVIERILDITKPPPANYIDRVWHNGFGVVLDDVMAGIYACLIIHGIIYVMPEIFL
jgi:phosphatidylglycerophosphatase A